VPVPTPVAVSVVAALAVSKFARLLSPVDDPASTIYDVIGPALEFHSSVTVDPLTEKLRPPGALGGVQADTEPPLTATASSLDGGPRPAAFAARTLTK
jgi:hypothetical protein